MLGHNLNRSLVKNVSEDQKVEEETWLAPNKLMEVRKKQSSPNI